MLPVTIDSVSAWLLPYSAEWRGALVVTLELLTDAEIGRSGREHRRAFSAALRTTFKFGSQLFPAEAVDLLSALEQSTDNRPILVPFWPAAGLFADRSTAPVTGGLRVWFEADWSTYQIGADGAANPTGYSASALTAPLLWCRWVRRPDAELLTGSGDLDLIFEVTDVGPSAYALTPQGGALTYGAPVGGVATPALSPALVDWVRPTASTEIVVERERIGYGRVEAEEFVAQLARRTQKLEVRCVGASEIAQLIRLFLDRRGNVGAWWCPSFNDTAAATLVRFKAARLQLTWSTPLQVDATVEVIGVPTEAALPSGEARGSTIGDIGSPCWLYVVTDGDLTWRFTSYESSLNAGALGTFTPVAIDHGDITSELNLQRHDVDLTVGWFAGSPFERARLDRLAPPLTVQIYEGAVANPSAAALIFTGKAAGYRFEGGKCTCKVAGPTALFDIRGPVAVTSPRCWTPMYSPLCGLSRAAMSMPATLVAASGNDFHFELSGAPAIPLDYFRFGYAERIAGGQTRRWPIVGSDVLGSAVTLPTLPGTLQTETSAWVTAATSAGGSLTDTTKAIADALIVALKASSAWPKLAYVLPFLGSNLAAGLTPLRDSHSFGRPTNNAFVDDDFSERTGLRGDGVTKTLVAPFSPHELGTGDNAGLGVWPTRLDTRTGVGGTSGVLGFRDTTEGEKQYSIVGSPTVPFRFRYGPVPAGDAISSTTACQHYYGQRSSATARTLYASGVEAAANSASVSITTGGGGVGTSFRPGLMGLQSNASDTVPYWAGTTALVYATDGTLTPAEVAELHAIFRDYLMVPTYRLTSAERVTLSPAPSVPAALPESGWTLVPGCGHSWSDCRARGNSDSFRGFPHFPKSNPAMVSVKQETPSTSKK